MSLNTPWLNDDRLGTAGRSAETFARRRNILLAEDDPDLLPLKREILRGAGYNVHGFATAEESFRFFQIDPAVDLLLADIRLGSGQTGVDLAERIAELKPALPTLLMSGSVLSEIQLRKIRARQWTFVRKPLRVTRLLSIIELLLHKNASSATFWETELSLW